VLHEPSPSRYVDPDSAAIAEPFNDLALILGFFERAYLLQAAGSADDPIVCGVGREGTQVGGIVRSWMTAVARAAG
jgi:hypothetical protein